MRVSERRCCICGCKADPKWTSAHIVVVLWLCTEHGSAFHHSTEYFAAQWSLSSAKALGLVDEWCERAFAALPQERRLAA